MAKRMNFTRKNRAKKTLENVGFLEIKNATDGGAELYIYGDIVSSEWDKWAAEDTCPQDITDFMSGIDNDADLTVYINSCGGDVFAGIGIYNILNRHKGHVTGVVDGIAASIASVILMACDDIIVSTGAQIMIHKPLTMAWGNADDLAAVIKQLDACQKMITDVYMTKAKEGVTAEKIEELINAETWMTGNEAAEYFNVKVNENAAAVAACVGCMMDKFKNAPSGMETETASDIEAREQQESEKKEILADLYMYG
uniref:Putative ATP dependent Clp protease n=1 Tax=Myoviridae sp. ctBvM24 TaxID=2825050 RepID=A0A8S5UCW0_9CAUD|nr:MAG TPA: putative ATP dependent Clp protease [Myoviridae sp. ctBvM24]